MTKKGLYDYSSLQVNLPSHLAKKVIKWGDEHIKESDVYDPPRDRTHGREDEPHVTILYGIHSQNPEESIELFSDQHPFTIHLSQISLFDSNPDFDVVKIEASSPMLNKFNYMIKTTLNNTQKFINYKPHVTIAYVKKDKCKELNGNNDFKNIHWTVNSLIFSSKNGHKTPIRLKQSVRSA